MRALRARLGASQSVLDEVAPERLAVGRRQVKVHYPRDQQPWIASRLQDFFGMRETPRVARGKVAVVVHLLAPNQRPVQMTSDLAGFWQRLYPQVRQGADAPLSQARVAGITMNRKAGTGSNFAAFAKLRA